MRRGRLVALASVAALGIAGLGHPASGQQTAGLRVFDSGGLTAETAALLLSGQQGGDLPLEALAVVVPAGVASPHLAVPATGAEPAADPAYGEEAEAGHGDGASGDSSVAPAAPAVVAARVDPARPRIGLLVEIAGHALVAGRSSPLVDVEILAYALTADNSVQESVLRTVRVDLREEAGEILAGAGLKLYLEMPLAASDLSLRLLVRDRETRRTALRVLPVPGPPAAPPARWLGKPLLADPDSDWLLAEPAAAALAAAWGLPATPAALPLLAPGAEALLAVPATGFGGGALAARLLVFSASDEVVSTLPMTLALGSGGPAGGLLAGRFVAPDLPTGRYELAVAVAGPGGEIRGERSPGVLLADWASALPLWPLLLQPEDAGAEGEAAEAVAEVRRRRRRADLAPLRAGYRAALEQLAAGQRAAAVEAVAKLESDFLAAHAGSAISALWEAELEVAQVAAKTSPQAILPLCDLHRRLYARYRERGQLQLASFSRTLLLQLLPLYVQTAGPEGREVAGQLYTVFGGDLEERGLPGLAAAAFADAIALDPGNRAAVLARVVGHERRDEVYQAVDLAAKLLAIRPGDPEVTLRHGVGLARERRNRPAAERLKSLLDTEEAWIASLAHHELVRLLASQRQWGEAEAVARAGMERLPQDEKLALLLAWLLERRGGDGEEALAAVSARKRTGPGDAPRHRYARFPAEAVAQVERALLPIVQASLPSLGAALGAATEGEP